LAGSRFLGLPLLRLLQAGRYLSLPLAGD